ncbi:hypothetical protein QR680_009541 [Steinernema hermaphroditum]|uniref:C2H2-type domain-containing protein n=1 Tax=Steinernema hermaphroditum TaxID=289476 RepID=A0AA39IMR3_9BILA|nr:hypothetical protein QR680_009541 [Steinernema hermaphroditum]
MSLVVTEGLLPKHSENTPNANTQCGQTRRRLEEDRRLRSDNMVLVHIYDVSQGRAEMTTPGYLRCAYCDVHTSTHLSYIEHVRTIHNGNHTIDHKCLDSEDDFKGWLISLKKKFGVDFVKRRGDKNTTTGRTVRMFCSRSGSATESSKLTQSGIIPKISIRCRKDCTAFLLAHVTESSINVQYCLEHCREATYNCLSSKLCICCEDSGIK